MHRRRLFEDTIPLTNEENKMETQNTATPDGKPKVEVSNSNENNINTSESPVANGTSDTVSTPEVTENSQNTTENTTTEESQGIQNQSNTEENNINKNNVSNGVPQESIKGSTVDTKQIDQTTESTDNTANNSNQSTAPQLDPSESLSYKDLEEYLNPSSPTTKVLQSKNSAVPCITIDDTTGEIVFNKPQAQASVTNNTTQNQVTEDEKTAVDTTTNKQQTSQNQATNENVMANDVVDSNSEDASLENSSPTKDASNTEENVEEQQVTTSNEPNTAISAKESNDERNSISQETSETNTNNIMVNNNNANNNSTVNNNGAEEVTAPETAPVLTTATSPEKKQEKQIFLDSSVLRILEELHITPPKFMCLRESAQEHNLNSIFKTNIAEYLNSRNIYITFISKDKSSGRIKLESPDGKGYFIDEINNFIKKQIIHTFEEYDPLSNDDIIRIKGYLTNAIKNYKIPSNKWLTGGNKDEVSTFTLGNVVKSIKESLIRKFREATYTLNDEETKEWEEYKQNKNKKDEVKENSTVEIEFNVSSFLNKGNSKGVNTTAMSLKLEVIPALQKYLCEDLNKQKFELKYKPKELNEELIYQVVFDIGNEKNTRFVDDKKEAIVFTLKVTKWMVSSEQNKNEETKKSGILGKIVGTLATASGAVAQANRASNQSKSNTL